MDGEHLLEALARERAGEWGMDWDNISTSHRNMLRQHITHEVVTDALTKCNECCIELGGILKRHASHLSDDDRETLRRVEQLSEKMINTLEMVPEWQESVRRNL